MGWGAERHRHAAQEAAHVAVAGHAERDVVPGPAARRPGKLALEKNAARLLKKRGKGGGGGNTKTGRKGEKRRKKAAG